MSLGTRRSLVAATLAGLVTLVEVRAHAMSWNAGAQHSRAVVRMQQQIAWQRELEDREFEYRRRVDQMRRRQMNINRQLKVRRPQVFRGWRPPQRFKYMPPVHTNGFVRHIDGSYTGHRVNFGSISDPTPGNGFGEFNASFGDLRGGASPFHFGALSE